jgi:hypothetical protein
VVRGGKGTGRTEGACGIGGITGRQSREEGAIFGAGGQRVAPGQVGGRGGGGDAGVWCGEGRVREVWDTVHVRARKWDEETVITPVF